MNLASLYNIAKGKKLSKISIKTVTGKLVPGCYVFAKN